MQSLDVTKTQYKVSDFLSWQSTRILVLSPSFQRRSVWKQGAKSYLIDTIAKGLPIPIIFLRDQWTDLGSLQPRREVVDGQQRLRTLISYIQPSILPDYDPKRDAFKVLPTHNREIANRKFNQLLPVVQRAILDYEFSVHVLSSEVGDREVLSIFARMNSTGVKLNQQELRNAEFFGAFKTSVYETASSQLPRWRSWGVFDEDAIARMDEVEITTEFALLMLKGVTAKHARTLSHLYKDNDEDFPQQGEIEQRFNTIMNTIEDNLRPHELSELFSFKAVFYGLFAFLYDVQFSIGSPVTPTNPKPVSNKVITGIRSVADSIHNRSAPQEVLDSITRRSTNLQERSTVLKYFKEKAGNA